VNLKAVIAHKLFVPAVGAALSVLCGWVLWGTTAGDRWVNVSYDYLFRFGGRGVTNKVVLVVMDEAAYDALHQSRESLWDRGLHTQLLNKLTADGCPLVVFDVFFGSRRDPDTDQKLADAMRQNGRVVLMAKVADARRFGPGPRLSEAQVLRPDPLFLGAATNCGVGRADAEVGDTPRRHWRAPSGEEFTSLAWTAAQLTGARLDRIQEQQWIRYYDCDGGEGAPWDTYSYHAALSQAPGYFRDRIVFIGNSPKRSDLDSPELDKFNTPCTRWTGKAVGGVEIVATTFLNLVNHDWLRRPAAWVEAFILLVCGLSLGAGLTFLRPLGACATAAGAALALTLGAVALSYFTNLWFPWFIVVGGQVPCALGWAVLTARPRTVPVLERFPGYTTVGEPLGEGAYGRVWLARDTLSWWHALKEIERTRFSDDGPYDREFEGIKNYKPISTQHPGLLPVEFVYRDDRRGYFFYSMQLGDARNPAWDGDPSQYQPLDLAARCALREGGRLPVHECVSIGIALADALAFLHDQGLTHRDIKPSNIIFVKGNPKLADVGLVTAIKPDEKDNTLVGTPGYMPPLPEPPGTAQADIYSLGMVLYVIRTGRKPELFPVVSTTLLQQSDFAPLNSVITKACHPDRTERFASAARLLAALRDVARALENAPTKKI
jgi:CHASE2 domain-containing sensor protein